SGRRERAADRDRLPERCDRRVRRPPRRRRAAEPGPHCPRKRTRAHVTSRADIERRYANVRAAAAADGLDAVVVSGSEYTGFEGAVRYLSGFRILHRYAYVVLPVDGDPAVVFPREARWVGDH